MELEIYKNLEKLKTFTCLKWGGSEGQVSRFLSFDYVVGSTCSIGDKITFYVDGALMFAGQVISTSYSADRKNMSVHCLDSMFNMAKSSATGRFTGTLGTLSAQICSIFGLVSTILGGFTVHEIITTGDLTYYDIIQKAAKEEYGTDKFNIRMVGSNFVTMDSQSDVVVASLRSTKNIINASYSESIENIINRIQIVDSSGNVIETREDGESISSFGIFQNVERDRKDDNTRQIELKSPDYSASIMAIGNIDCITGKKVAIYEEETGISGDFFIAQDEHSWEGGVYTMNLELSYV